MSQKYTYTADVPMIFSDLSHGKGVHVEHRAPEPVEGEEPQALPEGPVEGSTVVLEPGDILTLDQDDIYVHAWLEPIEKGEASKVTVKEIEADLDARGIDHTGITKKAELVALLDGAVEAEQNADTLKTASAAAAQTITDKAAGDASALTAGE